MALEGTVSVSTCFGLAKWLKFNEHWADWRDRAMTRIEARFEWKSGMEPDPNIQREHEAIAKQLLHGRFRWEASDVVPWHESSAWAVSHLSGNWHQTEEIVHMCAPGCFMFES